MVYMMLSESHSKSILEFFQICSFNIIQLETQSDRYTNILDNMHTMKVELAVTVCVTSGGGYKFFIIQLKFCTDKSDFFLLIILVK